jgi:hypothetical protein
LDIIAALRQALLPLEAAQVEKTAEKFAGQGPRPAGMNIPVPSSFMEGGEKDFTPRFAEQAKRART